MSEVQSRAPARGRGSSRGGRGGGSFGGSNARGTRTSGSGRTNGEDNIPIEEQGELGKLKAKYATQLSTLQEMFPDWTGDDLVGVLDDTAGDLATAANMISEGHASQWGEVKKKTKDRARSKTPASAADGYGSGGGRVSSRGGRGSYDGGRNSRGRGGDRGGPRGGRGSGGAGRGRPAAGTNGTTHASVKDDIAAVANEWGSAPANAEPPNWDAAPAAETGDDKPRDESDWDTGAAPAAPANAWAKAAAAGTGWDNEPKPAAPAVSGWGDDPAKPATPAAPMSASEKPATAKSSIIPPGTKTTWASMFKTTAPPPAPTTTTAPPKKGPPPPKAAEQPSAAPTSSASVSAPSPAAPPTTLPTEPKKKEEESAPPPPATQPPQEPPVVAPALPEAQPSKPAEKESTIPAVPPVEQQRTPVAVPAVPAIKQQPPPEDTNLAPPTDRLTNENLEKLEDSSVPHPTTTVASTAGTTPIPSRENSTTSVPLRGGLPAVHRAPGSRTGLRRILDQQEAVVMPRDHSIERTAVQFGSMGLGGEVDEPEEPEQKLAVPPQPKPTTQPAEQAEVAVKPQESPAPQQKSSLPPPAPGLPQPSSLSATNTPSLTSATQATQQEQGLPPTRGAPGLTQTQPQAIPQQPSAQTSMPSQSQSLPQQSRLEQKFENFAQQQQHQHQQGQQQQGQQPNQQQQQPQSQQQQSYGSYGQLHQQHASQQGLAGGMPSEYANYYGSDRFQGYYNQSPYTQHAHQQQQQGQGQNHQDTNAQQRSQNNLGTSVGSGVESHQPSSGQQQQQQQPQQQQQQQQQPQSRFMSAAQGADSGHGTPSPGIPSGQQAAQHQPQYPMHPSYYPYYNYMSQMYGYPGFQNGAKGFYGQPHQGFMNPGYDQSSSPGGLGGFGGPSSQGRDSSISDYGRTSSSQSHPQQPQHSGFGFGNSNIPDFVSSRGQGNMSGLGSQQQMSGLGAGPQGVGQQGAQADDALKPFGDSKSQTGASQTGAPGRPPSATSGVMAQQGGQSQIPPGQQQQGQVPMGAGGYPHHVQGQSAHNLGMGGMAGQGGHQSSGYGMYGGFGQQYPSGYGSQGTGRQSGAGGWGYGH